MEYKNDKPKLTRIETPGTYGVRVCKIRDDDVSTTQAGAPKIKVLLVTKDSQKITETFFGSTDGALRRVAAFVGVACQQKGLGLPPRDSDGLRAYLDKAAGRWLKVDVVQEEVTFSSGEKKMLCKVTKYHPLVEVKDSAPPF